VDLYIDKQINQTRKSLMKIIYVILVTLISSTFVSCNGQTKSSSTNVLKGHGNEIGKVVDKLSDSIWYVYQDKMDNYWFASNGQGVFRYDGKTLMNYTTQDGLANDTIRMIKEDRLGNIYFSNMDGINQFDGKKIITLKPIESKEWRLDSNDLWFCILGRRDEHGPYRFDGKNLYHHEFPKHFLQDSFYKKGINPFFSPYEVYSIYKDRKGHIWFGTSVFGACRYDGKSVSWMFEHDLTIVPNGGSFGIRSIYEDKNGDYWFCNTLHRYRMQFDNTGDNGKLKYSKTAGIGNAEIFGGDDYIYYSLIVEDNKGSIWLTTWSQGVYQYDGAQITHYDVKDGTKDINLVSMYKDNRGVLWLGTPENGVYKFNGKSFEKFKPNL
jgi:ligand-binding sensor domain-containing protein